MLVSPDCIVNDFSVIDCDINFSDHLPLLANLSSPSLTTTVGPTNGTQNVPKQSFPLVPKCLGTDVSWVRSVRLPQTQLNGCIVWNAHNTVLGEEARLIYTSFRYAM